MKLSVFLTNLFDTLRENNVQYAVLRNYEELPESTGGSDIDIWVSKKYSQIFFQIVNDIAKKCNGKLVSYIWKRHEPKICFLGDGWGAQFDVYIDLVPIGNYEFFYGDLIERHIVSYRGVNVLEKKWCAIESFLKEVLNTGSCDRKECFYRDAALAIRSIDIDELKAGLPMFSDAYVQLLARIGREPKTSDLIAQIYKKGKNELTKRAKHSWLDWLLKLKRIWRKPGFMIAILGTDGAGKSAIYQGIYPHLEGAFHHGVFYRHLRPHLLPDLGVLLHKRKEEKNVVVCDNPHAKKEGSFIQSLVRLSYYALDYIFGYLKLILPKISFYAKVYVMDRYYYDYYIDQKRSLISLPVWIIKLVDFFIPSPDIILCLGGDPQKIYKRKPETSLKSVSEQMDRLRHLCMKKNAVWIDTTRYDLQTSINLVLSSIAQIMSKRFERVDHL